MKKKPKYKPERDELLHYQEDVKDRHGKEYGLSVKDKVGADGVTEAHFDFTPHWRPKGAKSRGNFRVGMCLPTCKCQQCRRKKCQK